LISNAVKYNDKVGESKCDVLIYYKDAGPGIAEAYQQKVFQVLAETNCKYEELVS
jgi:signal transduction histidine kinase